MNFIHFHENNIIAFMGQIENIIGFKIKKRIFDKMHFFILQKPTITNHIF